MIVFDVDGTLIGGESVDWQCFDDAFEEAAGAPFRSDFFHNLEEVTAQAIVHQALDHLEEADREEILSKTQQGLLTRLREAHRSNPSAFPAVKGALELWQDLQERGIPFAIATRDWRDSIHFKLSAARLPFENVPMATSSDCYSRADIIATAVERAGGDLNDCVYVGDGIWDLRATQKLGIPFIGCGARLNLLKAAGAINVIEDLHPSSFWKAFDRISH